MACCRKLFTRRSCLVTCCLLTAAMLPVVMIAQDLVRRRCSQEIAQQVIVDLCELYRDGQVAGSMCNKLCEEKVFKLDSCMNNHVGKNVMFLECGGCERDGQVTNVVFKSQWDMSYWNQLNTKVFSDRNESIPAMTSRTISMINEAMEMYFGQHYKLDTDEYLSRIWNQDFKSHVKSGSHDDAARVALMSIYSLGSQLEYLSMAVMGQSRRLPNLYGTCGYAYFVENTPSLSKLNYILFQGKMPEVLSTDFHLRSWKQRALVALQLIDTFESFENDFPTTLQMCDLKTHNIGLNSRNNVILLDSDSLHFEGTYPELTSRSCLTDEHCRILDCHTTCNVTSNRCLTRRTNNNLQSLCRNIFISGVEKLGLLRFPPASVRDELYNTVHECADINTYSGRPQQKRRTHTRLMRQLRDLLTRSI